MIKVNIRLHAYGTKNMLLSYNCLSACIDLNNDCGSWTSMNHCTNEYRSFMEQNCPMSCGFCGISVSHQEQQSSAGEVDNTTQDSLKISH